MTRVASIAAIEFWPGSKEIRAGNPTGETFAMVGSREGDRFLFTVPFQRTDAGRSGSRRPRQKMDCTVRALATVANTDYDAAYDELLESGRRSHQGFNFRAWAHYGHFNGWRFEWVGFPATKGFWRVNPVLFALKFPKGRFVLRTAKHVLACVDGVIYDDNRGAEASCVYGAWRTVSL